MSKRAGGSAKAPAEYFSPGQWPLGAPYRAPVEAYYAALVARAVAGEIEVIERREGIRQTPAIARFAAETGLAVSTLVHILYGDRWIGLATLAKLEWALKRRLVGPDMVYQELLRHGSSPADLL